MPRRSFELKVLSIAIVILGAFGCSRVETQDSAVAEDLWSFLWQRSWKYPIENLPEGLRLATPTLGSLTVAEGSFNYRVPTENTPWASWWYPSREKLLFDGKNAPLRKFDSLRTKILRKDSTTAAAAQTRWSSQSGAFVAWEGLCDSWALASVYEYEPTNHLMVGDVCLTPGDQRALLISAYKTIGGPLKENYFGQLNRNGPNDIYADLYPDQLHRIVVTQLRDRKSAFLIDTDPRQEIWTVPVYEASLKIKKINETSADVSLMLTYPEFQFTEEDRRAGETKALGKLFVKRQYTYRLFGTWAGSELMVEGGEWTGASDKDHPDYAIVLPGSLALEKMSKVADASQVDYQDLKALLATGRVVSSCTGRE